VIFITHNVHHAYPVGDVFTILNRGRTYGTFRKEEVTREEVLNMMAGGKELDELSAELEEFSRIDAASGRAGAAERAIAKGLHDEGRRCTSTEPGLQSVVASSIPSRVVDGVMTASPARSAGLVPGRQGTGERTSTAAQTDVPQPVHLRSPRPKNFRAGGPQFVERYTVNNACAPRRFPIYGGAAFDQAFLKASEAKATGCYQKSL
jgi:hypothetical protein